MLHKLEITLPHNLIVQGTTVRNIANKIAQLRAWAKMQPTVINLNLPSIRPTTVILLFLRQIKARKGYVASRRARETAMQMKIKKQISFFLVLTSTRRTGSLKYLEIETLIMITLIILNMLVSPAQ